MVGSSKILTVSYGTFSCTLEGFDDPFSTMRSIAEYFRDLAADDRYFGAEPPTPDAEMLHRIAEREVQRQVEAKVQNDGIVLRQMPGGGVAAEPPADLGEQPNQPEEPADTPEPQVAQEERSLPAAPAAAIGATEGLYAEDEEAAANAPPDAAAVPVPMPDAGDESVAAKLSRIRAVVAGTTAASATSDTAFSGSIESVFDDRITVEDAEFEDVAGSDDDEPVQSIFEDDHEASSDTGHDDSSEDAPDDGSQPFAADITEKAKEADDLADGSLWDDEVEATHGAAEDMSAADGGATPQDAGQDRDGAGPVQLGLAARIVQLKRSALEAAQSAETAGLQSPEESTLSDEDEAELQRELAAAEETDTSDIVADDLVGDEPAHEEHAVAEDPIEDVSEQVSSDDQELDASDEETDEPSVKDVLARATRAEDTGELVDDDASDTMRRHPGFDREKTEEAAFDRILEQTNSRMDDDEGSRRRSAIAHLKAAVAATKADRLMKRTDPGDEAAEEESQYRDDLAKVVQPRRPLTQPRDEEAAQKLAKDAGVGEPGPLVLVSEQRVDGDQDDDEMATSETVDPESATETHGTEEGFTAFAAKVGATELPDLLEAAAAYTAFVEGNKLFSRPQLMRRVAHVENGDSFTREAGLRSFGQLLRQGKIQKLKRGQFTISEETRFNPQARLAGE
ncbi:MAG: hypothetical protein AAF566_09465 [Pseudomonadota bacterium]